MHEVTLERSMHAVTEPSASECIIYASNGMYQLWMQ